MTTKKPTVALHAFSSAKGGVGKSTLAIAAAHIVARPSNGRKAVVIDCDLTGSSLADGLRLRAPAMPRNEFGALDLTAPSVPEPLSVEETTKLIDERMSLKETDPPSAVPFFNDALTFTAKDPDIECNIASMTWRDEVNDAVLYLPSSSAREDIRLALAWLYEVDSTRWTRRFAWVLDQIATTVEGVTDVMIDLPPGLFGFSQSVLTLLTAYLRGEELPEGFPDSRARVDWLINPFLISTPDTNDLFTAVRAYGRISGRLHNLRLIVNQDSRPDDTRRAVTQRFPVLGPDQLLYDIAKNESLGRLFRSRRLELDADSFWKRAAEALRLGNGNGVG